MAVDIDGVNSTISTDKLIPQSGTALQIGESGDTVTLVGSAVGFGGGKIVQIVNVENGAVATGTVAIPMDDTIPQNTEGFEVMTLAITPTSATNKLLITVTAWTTDTSGAWCLVALFQDTTANALATGGRYSSTATAGGMTTFSHYMTSGTASETTFKVRVGHKTGGTMTFNGQNSGRMFGGTMASSITIQEISV